MDICGELRTGQNNTCPESVQKVYAQSANFINFNDILSKEVTKECTSGTEKYRIKFALKEGTKAVQFTAPARSNAIRGWVEQVTEDNGLTYYMHHVQIVLTGVNETVKCILSGLDKGLFMVALKFEGAPVVNTIQQSVEIYGAGTGLVTAAGWTYNIVETNGVTILEMVSRTDVGEVDLPYMYEAGEAGNESLDFDALFEAPTV